MQALAANPVLQAALDAVLPGYLDSILDNDDIREGVGVIAQQVVTDLLRNNGFGNFGLASAAGQVAEAATVSLLANPAFGGLLTDLAADIINGTPVSEVTTVVVQSVLRDPAPRVPRNRHRAGDRLAARRQHPRCRRRPGGRCGGHPGDRRGFRTDDAVQPRPGGSGGRDPARGYFELVPDLNAQVSSITVTVTV